MRLVGECSEATTNNGIVKVLITIHGDKQPEYVLLNLIKERGELEAGKIYRITIEEDKTAGASPARRKAIHQKPIAHRSEKERSRLE